LENPLPAGKELQALAEKAGPATKSVPVKLESPARKTIKQQFEEIKSDFQSLSVKIPLFFPGSRQHFGI
jgi:hypothetical protein